MKFLYPCVPVILSVGLLGCNDNQNQRTEVVETPPKTEEIKTDTFVSGLPDDAPVIKVVTTGNQPPFTLLNEYGNVQGIDIDAIRAIGETQGFKVDFYREAWQKVFPTVVSGKYDLAISGISYSPQRNEDYLLSNSYLYVPSAIMYTDKSLNIQGLESLEGLRFGGMDGAKQVNDVVANVKDVEVITTKTMFLAYQKLIRGEVDAIAEDLQWLEYTLQSNPNHADSYIVAYEDENDLPSQQIIMMKKGNTELANNINEGIAKLKASGTFDKIEAKWVIADH